MNKHNQSSQGNAVGTPHLGIGLKTFLPFLRPYRRQVFFALIALVVTAGAMLSLGKGVQFLIDRGLASGDRYIA